MGGLTVAIALQRLGVNVTVYEQAPRFERTGAGIQTSPNATHALDGLGIGQPLREVAYRPLYRLNRTWDTGEVISLVELGDVAEAKYGAPALMFHRADLLSVLASGFSTERLNLGRRLIHLNQGGERIELKFADGSRETADLVIGADGIHSNVREALFGPQEPHFTGAVGFRTILSVEKFPGMDLGPFTKWWGPRRESEIIHSLINRGRELYIMGSIPQPEWRQESWSTKASPQEMRAAFADYHEDAKALLEPCEEVMKTALYQRHPLPQWSRGNVTLLGDACHPMAPFMAQGGAMAIEDAIVLSRCLEKKRKADLSEALSTYEKTRRERTSRIQHLSYQNQWLRSGGSADWVFGFDPWSTPLAE